MTEKLDERDVAQRPKPSRAEGPKPSRAERPKPSKAERLEAKAARLRETQERRAADAAAGTGPARRGFVVATALLAVLAAALTAVLVVLYLSWRHQRDLTSARDGAATAAKAFAVDFGSYDYRHLDSEFTEVATRMTPDFAKSYLDTSDRLKATFEQYRTQVTARIQGYGVTSATTSRATVVVFLDQTVRTSQSSTPRIDRNRLQIVLVHQHGRWLVQRMLAK